MKTIWVRKNISLNFNTFCCYFGEERRAFLRQGALILPDIDVKLPINVLLWNLWRIPINHTRRQAIDIYFIIRNIHICRLKLFAYRYMEIGPRKFIIFFMFLFFLLFRIHINVLISRASPAPGIHFYGKWQFGNYRLLA